MSTRSHYISVNKVSTLSGAILVEREKEEKVGYFLGFHSGFAIRPLLQLDFWQLQDTNKYLMICMIVHLII